MAKTITIPYKNKEYTLEFTRNSISQMEKQGFRTANLDDMPMTTLPKFFAGAFIANHPLVKEKLIEEIFGNLTDKEGLFQTLSEMFAEPFESLMAEPETDKQGNLKWVKNW